jgi:hypothetical protein
MWRRKEKKRKYRRRDSKPRFSPHPGLRASGDIMHPGHLGSIFLASVWTFGPRSGSLYSFHNSRKGVYSYRCEGTSHKSIYKSCPISHSIKVVQQTARHRYSHQKKKSEHEKLEGYEEENNLAINNTDTKENRTGFLPLDVGRDL